MKSILSIVGSYIKSHVVTAIAAGTAIVGSVATPVIVSNIEPEQAKPVYNNVVEENKESDTTSVNDLDIEQVEEEKKEDCTSETVKQDPIESNIQDNIEKHTNVEQSKSTEGTESNIEQPTNVEQGLVIDSNKVYYNGTLLATFTHTIGQYTNSPLIMPSYDIQAINSVPSSVKAELLNRYCEATKGGCYYNIVSGLNEPYYYRKYRELKDGGQGGLDNARNDIATRKSNIEFSKKCIVFMRDGIADSTWSESDINDPGFCYRDQGYTVEAFERVISSSEQIIKLAEHDIELYTQSNAKFKQFTDLLR